ncbi:hypothetical protein Dimus_008434 [Dionaea muscipula]
MESPSAIRRPCFIEEDDGLASLADIEAGISGVGASPRPFFSRTTYYSGLSPQKKTSLKNHSVSSPRASSSSPRSGRVFDPRFENHHHHLPYFLEACFLCKKPLGGNRDIFMYRGDTPFCSEECRQEQIEIDESKEKNWNLSASMKALRNRKETKTSTASTSPAKNKDYPYHAAGTVAAA